MVQGLVQWLKAWHNKFRVMFLIITLSCCEKNGLLLAAKRMELGSLLQGQECQLMYSCLLSQSCSTWCWIDGVGNKSQFASWCNHVDVPCTICCSILQHTLFMYFHLLKLNLGLVFAHHGIPTGMLLGFVGCRLCLGHVTGLRFWNFPGLLHWCLFLACRHVGWMQAVLQHDVWILQWLCSSRQGRTKAHVVVLVYCKLCGLMYYFLLSLFGSWHEVLQAWPMA